MIVEVSGTGHAGGVKPLSIEVTVGSVAANRNSSRGRWPGSVNG